MPKRRRKTRRVQYFPELVANKVLNNNFLRALTYLVYTSKIPVSAGELARGVSRLLSKEYSPGYVSVYLKRLEKWGVVRPYRDPVNGHLLWWRADTKISEIIAEELGRQEMKRILEAIEEW